MTLLSHTVLPEEFASGPAPDRADGRHKHSLPMPCCDFTRLVAYSVLTVRHPVTLGSSIWLSPVVMGQNIYDNAWLTLQCNKHRGVINYVAECQIVGRGDRGSELPAAIWKLCSPHFTCDFVQPTLHVSLLTPLYMCLCSPHLHVSFFTPFTCVFVHPTLHVSLFTPLYMCLCSPHFQKSVKDVGAFFLAGTGEVN